MYIVKYLNIGIWAQAAPKMSLLKNKNLFHRTNLYFKEQKFIFKIKFKLINSSFIKVNIIVSYRLDSTVWREWQKCFFESRGTV